MGHDEAADHARADTPGDIPWCLLFSLFVKERNVKGVHESLSEVVGCAHLECFAIRHERFDRGGVKCAGECFCGSFLSRNNGNGKEILCKCLVFLQEEHGFFVCFCLRRVDAVSFLPEEFACA